MYCRVRKEESDFGATAGHGVAPQPQQAKNEAKVPSSQGVGGEQIEPPWLRRLRSPGKFQRIKRFGERGPADLASKGPVLASRYLGCGQASKRGAVTDVFRARGPMTKGQAGIATFWPVPSRIASAFLSDDERPGRDCDQRRVFAGGAGRIYESDDERPGRDCD